MTSDVRPLTASDLDWVVATSAARREVLAPHAPRFWRPAADATARHRAFLTRLVDDPAALTLRTDHGYLMALGDATRRVVDDMAVTDEAWADEGVALLRAVVDATTTVRFVVPVAEPRRREAAEALGLRVAESWWHRDLPLVQVRGESDRVELSTAGARGRLVPAPPVYAPGGPVLLVTDVETGTALAALEDEAAERGATVSVVSQRADDLMRELLLVEAGHVRTTAFFETAP
ncbi:hypothetical protein [Nocardioides sp.]|uniref:hypothetical protein n=1 Tax=Nocardioides sp. TaxID=35761 RepID=UPI002720D728|nr:hypothetical protein [Nocardioides sp.]MDO9457891.1 hypothetical protein [Nocardioides sp.]